MGGYARIKDIIVGYDGQATIRKDTDVGKDGIGWNLNDENFG